MTQLGTGDYTIHIRRVGDLAKKLRVQFEAGDYASCKEVIHQIMGAIIYFPTFLDLSVDSPTATEEIALTRDVLELAVLTAARTKDVDEFERRYSQLGIYYNDDEKRIAIPPSERRLLITGVNLLRLLVCSRVAAFHSALERIHVTQQGNLYIRFPLRLERFLMEGSYNQLLNARSQAPANDFVPFVELLETTVRSEILSCIPRAYANLSVDEAQRVLMLNSRAEVEAYATKEQWARSADGQRFVFRSNDVVATREIPYADALRYNIALAVELQRVV